MIRQVPFNFLQTLAENAFTHGFKNIKEKELSFTAKDFPDGMEFVFENNGKIISAEECVIINNKMHIESNHALFILQKKFHSLYGDNFKFTFYTDEKERCGISIKLPYALKEGIISNATSSCM